MFGVRSELFSAERKAHSDELAQRWNLASTMTSVWIVKETSDFFAAPDRIQGATEDTENTELESLDHSASSGCPLCSRCPLWLIPSGAIKKRRSGKTPVPTYPAALRAGALGRAARFVSEREMRKRILFSHFPRCAPERPNAQRAVYVQVEPLVRLRAEDVRPPVCEGDSPSKETSAEETRAYSRGFKPEDRRLFWLRSIMT